MIDADAYAKAADFLPLNGIDHVEFWVGNARQAAAYYRALWGFTPVAFSGLETKVRDRASLRHGPERHPLRLHRPADARRRDRRARPRAWRRRPRHRLRGRGRRCRLAARRRRAARCAPWMPTEIDGGEDGVLRRASIHTYGEVLHSFVDRRDYHGAFAPGYRAVKRRPRAAERAVAARGRPLRRQRRARRDGPLRRLLPRRPRLRPAHPLRRQGHPHRLQRADVEGHDQRQRPDQVPDQRAGDRARRRARSRSTSTGIARPGCQHIALRTEDIVGDRPPAARQRRRVPGPAARVLRDARRPRRRRRRADRHRSRSSASRPTATRRATSSRSSPARSRTARRSSSRSSSGTARAASGSATSRRCSRPSSASRRSAGTSRRGSRARLGRYGVNSASGGRVRTPAAADLSVCESR